MTRCSHVVLLCRYRVAHVARVADVARVAACAAGVALLLALVLMLMLFFPKPQVVGASMWDVTWFPSCRCGLYCCRSGRLFPSYITN
jgi:hypothetical protein